jgi:hypothetical protein
MLRMTGSQDRRRRVVKRVLRAIGGLGLSAGLLLAGLACEPPSYAAQFPGLNIDMLCREILPLEDDEATARLEEFGVTDPLMIDLLLSVNVNASCP